MTPQADTSDGDLAAQAAAGDERAFTGLMRRHKGALYRLVRRYVGESDEAYDLVQETFTSAWRALKRYDRNRPFAAWLRTIALNKCRDWSRRRALRSWLVRSEPLDGSSGLDLPDRGRSPEDQTSDRQEMQRLDKAIAALPGGLKEPLILTVFEGLDQVETGKVLNMSAKAVEVRVYRAKKALAAALSIAD